MKVLIIFLILLFSSPVFSLTCGIRDGNIFLTKDDGKEIQLTKNLKASYAELAPDNKKIFFIVDKWVTSGAVYSMGIAGKDIKYIAPGNELSIIDEGEFKGYLLIRQHKYFVGGGSYDWLWLYTANGKVVGPIGEDLTQEQKEYLYP